MTQTLAEFSIPYVQILNEKAELSGPLPDFGCSLVFAVSDWYFSEPKKSDCVVDGDRTHAFGCQYQFRGFLTLPGRYARTSVCVFYSDSCRSRVRHRAGDFGAVVPQPFKRQC